jgi:RNA ligase
MLKAGFVRRQTHPTLPLSILNYTETAAFERVWNPVTKTCRGLIVSDRTFDVVARPWSKFMNFGEPGAPTMHLDAPVEVTDKLDGSLGILYPVGPGQFAVATRGSFDSEQAHHATAVWNSKYAGKFMPAFGVTYLFEIIYPSNRIVCDYGRCDDLFLLGAVKINTGQSFGPNESSRFGYWPGPSTQTFSYATLREALQAPPRPGAEGYVVRRVGSEERIKIKQDDYVALHRIITNCTARRIWEYVAVFNSRHFAPEDKMIDFLVRRLMLGPDRIAQVLAVGPDWLQTFQKNTPEEFRDWVLDRVSEFKQRHEERLSALKRQLRSALEQAHLSYDVVTAGPTREEAKAFAAVARDLPDFNLVMTLFRGGEVETSLWRELRPEHELPYRALDESVA